MESAASTRSSYANRLNLEGIEDYYARWKHNPDSVDRSWQLFFEGMEVGASRPAAGAAIVEGELIRLVDGYRSLGHFQAHLDPLSPPPSPFPLLSLGEFGFGEADLDRRFEATGLPSLAQGTLREMLAFLKDTYCRTIGVEYMYIQDTRIRKWLQERMESVRNRANYARRRKLRILTLLHNAEMFERFLHTRFPGQKRFSLEGAETLIPVLDAIVDRAPGMGVREIVMGMAHRGRLNVLANILQKPFATVFAEFEGTVVPDLVGGDGDVKYHLGFSSDYAATAGGTVHLALTPNPSHLEAVSPVVQGRVRAKQRQHGDRERRTGVPLLIHGDAAIAGQGLVAETLNLSQLSGYKTGGTIHIVVNNQIGFTTSPSDARSTIYCTDVCKMIEVPIFHVNGEDPEACCYVAELALDFRQTFHKDVVIDIYCYRRHGHNEGDDPSFTQPIMYRNIQEHPSLREVYTEQLILRGDLTVDETEAIASSFQELLQSAFEGLRDENLIRESHGFGSAWQGLSSAYSHEPAKTAVPKDTLTEVLRNSGKLPDSFHPHSRARRILETRLKQFTEKGEADWATAEALAFGALLLEGFAVRLSGQDSRRGTFSQRHAVLFDAETGKPYIPLNHLRAGQADFRAFDSNLSEAAVLGFEYGYALDSPNILVLWEAQFGDFGNGAQVIIDQFIVSGESKWRRANGIVLLLPHGYEGQGPEHSSGRLERFLQLCAEDNIQVCNLTTPAQYFHVLRRQLKRGFRKPLVLMTPKSLLRHKLAVSPVQAFTSQRFAEALDDPEDRKDARRILLCSGKVYYDLLQRRAEKRLRDAAIVRVEQFYPFSEDQLGMILRRYQRAREWAWVQEESQNMGGWSFMQPRLQQLLGRAVEYAGRDASASPATGSLAIHTQEQAAVVDGALMGPLPCIVRADARPAEVAEPSRTATG